MAATVDPPRTFEALRTELLERRATLPRRLTQVAAFAMDHPDEIAFGTVAGIAGQAGVQPSALVRFAQALGYTGFSEMQKVFRSRLRDNVSDYRERLAALRARGEAGGLAGLVAGFCEAADYSLSLVRQQAGSRALERCVDVLAPAETIYLVGQRRSFPVTAYLSYALSRIGVRNVLVDGVAGLASDCLKFAGPGDAAICVSFSPYSATTVELAADLHRQGVPVVSLTDGAFSPLVSSSSAWVEVVEADFGGFRSVAGTFVLAIALAVGVGERRGVPAATDDAGGGGNERSILTR